MVAGPLPAFACTDYTQGKVFLVSPHNVTVSVEDKERLAGGFFNQS